MKKKKKQAARGRDKPRIIIDRVYSGQTRMEDAFREINEQTVIKNVEAMHRERMPPDHTDAA